MIRTVQTAPPARLSRIRRPPVPANHKLPRDDSSVYDHLNDNPKVTHFCLKLFFYYALGAANLFCSAVLEFPRSVRRLLDHLKPVGNWNFVHSMVISAWALVIAARPLCAQCPSRELHVPANGKPGFI